MKSPHWSDPGKGDTGDDQLRGVSESGVEQSSQAFPDAAAATRWHADQPAIGMIPRAEQTKSAGGLIPAARRRKHRERNEDKEPVEDGLSFESRNFATCSAHRLVRPPPLDTHAQNSLHHKPLSMNWPAALLV